MIINSGSLVALNQNEFPTTLHTGWIESLPFCRCFKRRHLLQNSTENSEVMRSNLPPSQTYFPQE